MGELLTAGGKVRLLAMSKSACVTFALSAEGRSHAACPCLSLASHRADILKKSRQRKHVCSVMGISRDR